MSSIDAIAQSEVTAPPQAAGKAARQVLRVSGVTKTWRKAARPVLSGADLSLSTGTATWVGGENGAGKTTLLRIVAGLIAADSGEIRLLGLDVESDRRAYHQRVGFLSAGNTGLVNRLTVRGHLDYWAKLAFIPRGRRAAAIEDALERFDLRALADRRVERMSMGQRQRVRIALALLHEPDLLLLDEARTSLDESGADLLSAACQRLLERGGAILACSPTGEIRDEVPFDRRYLMREGRLEAIE